MNTKVLQINREVMGRYPFHSSKRSLPITMAGLLAVTLSGSALALPSDASGNLDLNSNGLPRLAPDICYAANSVNAVGGSNFPVGFRLFRDGSPVAGNGNSTTWFQANNGTFQFLPGNYQLVAVNTNPTRAARITLSLTCN